MKFHRTTVNAVVETLKEVFENGSYADKAIGAVLKQNSKWGARDRNFIAETSYQMVRWWRLINESLGEEASSVHHFYKLFATWQLLNGNEIPEWTEFAGLDKTKIIEKANELKQIRKYRESIPDWMDELGCQELGEELWTKELAELNKMAKLVLRVNTLKTNVEAVRLRLNEKQIESYTLPNFPDALISIRRQNFYRLEEYTNGMLEIQDASSQLVAPFMKLEPGMKVIDACAGAGGKSLHIAAMMKNKGEIVSMDVDESKLAELNKRAARAGISIIKTKLINPKQINELTNTADRLLLDVPCSGLGVLRRKPFDKWKLSMESIEEKRTIQHDILQNYTCMLKPGGILIYATCSILPSENQLQIEQFLNEHKNQFELIEDRKVLPSEGFDGFYMASIKKN